MGQLAEYRQLIKQILTHYAELINRRPKPSKETEVVFDEEMVDYTFPVSNHHRINST